MLSEHATLDPWGAFTFLIEEAAKSQEEYVRITRHFLTAMVALQTVKPGLRDNSLLTIGRCQRSGSQFVVL